VAQSRYQDAIEEIRNRQALLVQRRTELALAKQQLSDTSVYAPMDGIVQEKRASVGEYLAAGAPIANIVRMDPLRLRAEVPERAAQDVRVGQSVRVTVEGDPNAYLGQIRRLSPTISEQNRVLVAEADVSNNGRLRPDAFAHADIITNDVAPGYALADRLEALRGAAAQMNLPAAYTTTISGRGRELEKTFYEFIWAFLLSIAFMYMILASQFESLVHPFTILLSLPLSVPFALLSLWGTADTLNLYSALGVLVLFGVVKKNSILQIDHMNNLRAKGLDRYDAIMQGNRDRLRPILMTTLALVAGMLPLALGTGPGSEERRSIAVVVIGGQTLSLLLTLIATPVAYSLLDDLGATSRLRAINSWTSLAYSRLKGGLRAAFARRQHSGSDEDETKPENESGVEPEDEQEHVRIGAGGGD
jgi:HAE1 family hydrophobic/amphiphilic exporter-1